MGTGPGVAATVGLLLAWGAHAGAADAPAALFDYQGDHRALLAKDDDWRDPALADERRLLADRAARFLLPGVRADVPLASFTWGQPVRARVRVRLAGPVDPLPTLVGEAAQGWLTLRATAPAQVDADGVLVFELTAAQPLP